MAEPIRITSGRISGVLQHLYAFANSLVGHCLRDMSKTSQQFKSQLAWKVTFLSTTTLHHRCLLCFCFFFQNNIPFSLYINKSPTWCYALIKRVLMFLHQISICTVMRRIMIFKSTTDCIKNGGPIRSSSSSSYSATALSVWPWLPLTFRNRASYI